MDSFELNKLAGAVLFAVFMVLGLNFFSGLIFAVTPPETPAFSVAMESADTETAGASSAEPAERSVLAMLADADPAAGRKTAKKCVACHTFDKGGANKVGPNLWDIVNRKPATVAGFNYSGALRDHGETTLWTFAALDAYLENPKDAVPGNKMSFAGLKKAADRAGVLAYLRSQSDAPADLPATGETAEAAPEPAADTGGDKAPAPAGDAEATVPAETRQPTQ